MTLFDSCCSWLIFFSFGWSFCWYYKLFLWEWLAQYSLVLVSCLILLLLSWTALCLLYFARTVHSILPMVSSSDRIVIGVRLVLVWTSLVGLIAILLGNSLVLLPAWLIGSSVNLLSEIVLVYFRLLVVMGLVVEIGCWFMKNNKHFNSFVLLYYLIALSLVFVREVKHSIILAVGVILMTWLSLRLTSSLARNSYRRWNHLILVLLSSRTWFYLTDHTLQLNGFHLSVGLLGVSNFHVIYSGVTVLFNMFCHEIILLVWLSAMKWSEAVHLYLFHRHFSMWMSCGASFLLRRHLMFWDIFAPKTLLEICCWIVVSVTFLIINTEYSNFEENEDKFSGICRSSFSSDKESICHDKNLPTHNSGNTFVI